MIADRVATPIHTARSGRIAHRWLVAAVVVGTVVTGCGSVASVPSTTVDSSDPLPSVPATPPATTAPAPTSTDGLLVTGVGEESLIVVVHSVWPEGEDPSPELAALGDMQGFYFDRASNYEVLGAYVQLTPDFSTESVGNQVQPVPVELEHVELAALESEMSDGAECGREDLRPCPNPALLAFAAGGFRFEAGSTLALSGFRTKAGAEEFIEFARAFGVEGLFALRVRKTGGGYIGLGQEAHPDGSGPLLAPLPNIDAQF